MLSKKSQTALRLISRRKTKSRDDRSSICPQASYRSHRRVHRFMMPPPHIYKIAAPTARRLCHQQCKTTFSTASTQIRPFSIFYRTAMSELWRNFPTNISCICRLARPDRVGRASVVSCPCFDPLKCRDECREYCDYHRNTEKYDGGLAFRSLLMREPPFLAKTSCGLRGSPAVWTVDPGRRGAAQ